MLRDTCVTVDQQNELPYAHIAAGQECLLWGLRQRPQAYLLQCLIVIEALLLQGCTIFTLCFSYLCISHNALVACSHLPSACARAGGLLAASSSALAGL